MKHDSICYGAKLKLKQTENWNIESITSLLQFILCISTVSQLLHYFIIAAQLVLAFFSAPIVLMYVF